MTNRKILGIGTHAFGEASVLAVSSELILQGLIPYKPLVDDRGIDLMLVVENKACRIQIKAASLMTRIKNDRDNQGTPFYYFTFNKVRANYKNGVTVSSREFSKEVDFVILHCVDDNIFYIVPASLLDGKKSMGINFTNPKSKNLNLDMMIEDYNSGMTYKEIGIKYGISAPAAYERITGKTKAAITNSTQDVLDCQNKWELLTEFFQ